MLKAMSQKNKTHWTDKPMGLDQYIYINSDNSQPSYSSTTFFFRIWTAFSSKYSYVSGICCKTESFMTVLELNFFEKKTSNYF